MNKFFQPCELIAQLTRYGLMFLASSCALAICADVIWAQDVGATDDQPPSSFPAPGSGTDESEPIEEEQPPKSPFGPPPGAKPLSQDDSIWLDLKRNALFVDGRVALREGPPLEMFACPAHTKEHESVVAVHAKPSVVHAGLLFLNAQVGHPVRFDPYQPAAGTEVDIVVQWKDVEGRSHRVPAQHWVRSIKTKQALPHPWVFAGSGMWKDEETGERGYKGDSGYFICVSNFEESTLDLPIPSSADKSDLLYEAFTERIPPVGTPVRLVLLPRVHEKPVAEEEAAQPKKE